MKKCLILFLIVVCGLFLRLYKIADLMPFGQDEGWGYLVSRDAIINRSLPLFGPQTSLSWLKLGPLPYYLLTFAVLTGRFHPISVAFFLSLFDAAAIIIIYYVGKTVRNSLTGIAASILYALSPFLIIHSRTPLYVNFVPFLALVFYLFWFLFLKSKKNTYFLLSCFVLGSILQFHLTPIMLIPIFVYSICKKLDLKMKLSGIGIFLLPLLPYVYSELITGFRMTFRIFLWFPYRVFSAFGFFTGKNVLTFNRISTSFDIVNSSIIRTLMPFFPAISMILAALSFIYLISKIHTNKLYKMILFTITISIIGIFIHGQPSEHFLSFMLPLVTLTVAIFLSQNKWGLILVVVIGLINAGNLVFIQYVDGPSLKEKIQVVRYLIDESEGKPYEIVATPDIIDLPHYYDAYRYLGWWLGKQAVMTNGAKKYLIYERQIVLNNLPKGAVVRRFPHITVVGYE